MDDENTFVAAVKIITLFLLPTIFGEEPKKLSLKDSLSVSL